MDSQIRANRLILANRFRVPELQRAENGALDPWSLDLRLGRPRFLPQITPKPFKIRVWGLWTENRGAPKTQIQRPRIQRPILGPLRTEPCFCESRFEGLKIANRRFEAIRANRSIIMKIGVFLRIDSRESPRFALRIARPSKVRTGSPHRKKGMSFKNGSQNRRRVKELRDFCD